VASIHAAYDKYARGFEEITQRARGRFECRDWSGAQADARERLTLYKTHLDAAVADVRDILEDGVMERTVWAAMKSEHGLGQDRPDAELAETFFNSSNTSTRRRPGPMPLLPSSGKRMPPSGWMGPWCAGCCSRFHGRRLMPSWSGTSPWSRS
jgi:isocitrate dehydrogenase kinase/phosphatase